MEPISEKDVSAIAELIYEEYGLDALSQLKQFDIIKHEVTLLGYSQEEFEKNLVKIAQELRVVHRHRRAS